MRRVGATHDGVQASERGTDGQTGETRLGDGGVDDPLLAEAVEETLGDLVTAALVSSVLVAALFCWRLRCAAQGPRSLR